MQRPSRVIFLPPFGFVLVLFPRTAASSTFVSSRVRFPPSQRPTQPPRPSRTFQKETNRPPPRCGTRRGSRSGRSTTHGRRAARAQRRAAYLARRRGPAPVPPGLRRALPRPPRRRALPGHRGPAGTVRCYFSPPPLYIFICLSSLQFDLMSLMWCHRICECDARL